MKKSKLTFLGTLTFLSLTIGFTIPAYASDNIVTATTSSGVTVSIANDEIKSLIEQEEPIIEEVIQKVPNAKQAIKEVLVEKFPALGGINIVDDNSKFTPNLNGYYLAKEDNLNHLWIDGRLAVNEAVNSSGVVVYADSNGLPLDGSEGTQYMSFSCLMDRYGNSYIVGSGGNVVKGWMQCYSKDYRYIDYFYCDYNTGKIVKNAKVDGYTIGSDGKVIVSGMDLSTFSLKVCKPAETIIYFN